jgi:hypothetical protein
VASFDAGFGRQPRDSAWPSARRAVLLGVAFGPAALLLGVPSARSALLLGVPSAGLRAVLVFSPRMTRLGIFLCVMAALLGRARAAHAGPFEVKEVDWEGCSGLLELARAELGDARVVALASLDWSELKPEDAILLIHPDHAISSDKLAAFLRADGRVAVLDDFGAGDKILERFGIERVPPPERPLLTLRRNPELVIAEPVTESINGETAGVHATVANVERVITNHPMGLRNPKATPVLKMRSIDGPDVLLALAGPIPFDHEYHGKLFAMADPSVFINQMLRYPGNRAFAVGLLHWLAEDAAGLSRGGRLVIVANRFSETGTFAGMDAIKDQLENRLKEADQEIRHLFSGGLSGALGFALAALVAFGIGVWTTTVSSRVYRRRLPTFARSVPLVAQGGVAGRAAMLSASTTPRALAVLELKSALEEGLAHELGFAGTVPTAVLLEELKRRAALDERGHRALKDALLEMAKLETAVLARQPVKVTREDVLRLSRVVSEISARVRERRASRERAA